MNEELKDLVRAKYNQIALQDKKQTESSCCGSTGCCDSMDYTIMSEDYSDIEGYQSEADLGLGCGLPTEFANISKGNTIIDLGSGAGNDAFIARSIAGEEGKVIGLDFAGAMLTKARANASRLGFKNVEFVRGDIEQMPIEDNIADVVVSNCVLNLVPDKIKAFSEIYRVLKPGGHFCISDIVLDGYLPEQFLKQAELYAGCISGSIQKIEYLNIIRNSGFTDIAVKKEKKIILPDEILINYLTNEELLEFKSSRIGIFSITVYGVK